MTPDQAPARLPGNPGQFNLFTFTSTADTSRVEDVDAVALLADVLQGQGYAVERGDGFVRLSASGFVLLPLVVELEPLENGGVRTATTIQTHHPNLVPGGLFEYQHSTGDSAAAALRKGFDQWAQTDLVPLCEALQPTPSRCMILEMSFPAAGNRPARQRRVVLGPVAHLVQQPAPDPASEHPFCACCLLTRSLAAFRGLLEGDDFLGLRLFAMRDDQGQPAADCRVNGEDFEPGMAALREYVLTWPQAGYEFRKQYVVVQTVSTTTPATATPRPPAPPRGDEWSWR